jgi:hypothetical protein
MKMSHGGTLCREWSGFKQSMVTERLLQVLEKRFACVAGLISSSANGKPQESRVGLALALRLIQLTSQALSNTVSNHAPKVSFLSSVLQGRFTQPPTTQPGGRRRLRLSSCPALQPIRAARARCARHKQIRGGKAQLGKARAIGAATYDVVIGFESRRREGLARQLNRAHVFAQPISHVAILFADLAADMRPRLGGL